MDHDARVRTSLLTAPRWVLVPVYGVPFGLWMGLFGRFEHHDSWTGALITGVLAGLLFGLFMGMLTHRWNAQTRSLTRTPWWWLGVAMFAAMTVAHLVLPARLRRRIELLRAEGSPAP